MNRLGWLALAVVGGAAATAHAKLYHPELLTVTLRRPPLIDCGQGFDSALKVYFRDFAARDGVPLPGPAVLKKIDRSATSWVSHFEVDSGSKIYRGIIYVEPPIEDDDDDLPPPTLPGPRMRFCSAVFGDETTTVAEKAQIEEAYRSLCERFGVNP